MIRCTAPLFHPVRLWALLTGIVPALAVLMALTAVTPVYADTSNEGSCGVGQYNPDADWINFSYNINNINMKAKDAPVGTVLYESTPVTIPFICRIKNAYYPQQPALVRLAAFGPVYDALLKAGLNLQLLVNGRVWTPDTSGSGEMISLGGDYTSSTGPRTLSLGFRILRSGGASAPLTTVPGGVFFRIWPLNANIGSSNFAGPGIQFNSFTLQFIPECIGTVSILPSRINFGHVMTDYLSQTLPKERTFTVRAEANPSCPNAGLFSLSLNSEFSVSGVTVKGTDVLSLMNDKEEANGLQLTLKDELSGRNVAFGTVSGFGAVSPATPNGVSRNYTARLEQIPGETLKTGPFSADVVVTMTYN